jgi:YVTN family beta-propeller protein
MKRTSSKVGHRGIAAARSAVARIAVSLLVMANVACAADDPSDLASGCEAADGARVVTADWLNRSLTVLAEGRLAAGCSVEQAILERIDLSEYAPGPLEIEIAPDGHTALVSNGPGFFGGEGATLVGNPDIEAGGSLLIVDLDTAEVRAELFPAQPPMGIAIHPDGKRAFTANFGDADNPGSTISVIDLTLEQVVADVHVGALPEQVVLSDDGSLGVVNLAGEDAVRVFGTSDVAGTLGDPVAVGKDPSDIAFVGDTALVTNSQSFGFSLLQLADPALPSASPSMEIEGVVPFGATRVPGSDEVLVTGFLFGASITRVRVSDGGAELLGSIELDGGAFPIGAAVDPKGQRAFVAHPRDQVLSVVDLLSGEVLSFQWLTEAGPSYVAIAPP